MSVHFPLPFPWTQLQLVRPDAEVKFVKITRAKSKLLLQLEITPHKSVKVVDLPTEVGADVTGHLTHREVLSMASLRDEGRQASHEDHLRCGTCKYFGFQERFLVAVHVC